MRCARRLIFLVLLSLGMIAGASQRADAQNLQFELSNVSLPTALDLYQKQSGVSVVYADRVVVGRTANCDYSGADKEAALSCILGERLDASWLRSNQVVLRPRAVSTPTTSVRGTVVDSETGSPLPGAHVMVPGLNQGMVADEHGDFSFDEVPARRLRALVSYLGYEPAEVTLSGNTDNQLVKLSPQMIEGEAVVVEGRRSSESDEMAGMTYSLNRRMNESGWALGPSDMLQAASSFPGVGRTGEISGGLVVRGGLPDHSVFLLDGAPVYQPWHSQGLFSILQPSAVDDVLLYSGPLPADQTGQLAAVLDARLDSGADETFRSTASVTSSLGEVSVSTPIAPGLTGMVSARRSHQGLSRTHAQSLPNSQPLESGSFYDVAAKIGLQSSPANSFTFTMYRGGDNLTWSTDPESRSQDPRFGSWLNGVYVLSHRYIPNDRVLVTNSIYASTLDATSELSSEGLLGLSTNDEYQEIRDMGLRINVDYLASPRHSVNLGVQVVQHHIEWSEVPAPIVDGPPVRTTFRDEVVDGALYLQDTWSVTDRLTVRPGLRMSWFGNQVGQHFEPRFHSRYDLSKNSHLRLAWSRQMQYVHQVHNIVNGGLGSTITKWVVTSGPTTKPSQGDQFVFGLASRRNAYWTVSADLYWRHLENVFLPTQSLSEVTSNSLAAFDAPPERFEDFVQGTSKSYGLEVQATYKRRWFRFWSSYSGSRSLILLPNDADSEYRPGVYDTPHVVRASAGIDGSRWAFTLASEARTGYPTLATVKGGLEETSSDRFPTYFRLDASVGYRFTGFGAQWSLQGRVYNLTGRENVVGYEYDDSILNLRRTSLLGVRRWPTFRVQVTL